MKEWNSPQPTGTEYELHELMAKLLTRTHGVHRGQKTPKPTHTYTSEKCSTRPA